MQLTEASTESEITQEDCEERGGTWSEEEKCYNDEREEIPCE